MNKGKSVFVEARKGREFKWQSDHAYVKISSADSDGAFSLIEDNLTKDFELPNHMHCRHTETFYVMSGKVEFQLKDRNLVLSSGDALYIPANEPHKVRCLEAGKMLTLYQPGGLEKLFEAYEKMTAGEMADPEKMKAVDLAHDNIIL